MSGVKAYKPRGGSTVIRARENRGQVRLPDPAPLPTPPRLPAKFRKARLTINSTDHHKSGYKKALIVGIKEVALFGGMMIEVVDEPQWNRQPQLEDRGEAIIGLAEISAHVVLAAGGYLKVHRLGLGKK